MINLFQVTGLDEKGRYFMNPCPARAGDYIEFLAEQDLLMALSKFYGLAGINADLVNFLGTCPGGDLSLWGFGSDSEKEMIKCCRPLKVEVFKVNDVDWKPSPIPPYRGLHGMIVPEGESRSP